MQITQLDSYTGVPISEERLKRCLGVELWNDIKDLDVKIGEDVVKAIDFVEKSVEEIGKKIGREVKKDVEKIVHWLKI